MIVFLAQYCSGHQIEKNVMGEARMGRGGVYIGFWLGNMKVRDTWKTQA